MGLFDRLTKKNKNKKEDMKIVKKEETIKTEELSSNKNIYYKDVTVEYNDANIHMRIIPLTFTKIQEFSNKTKYPEEFYSLVIQASLLNKYDNKHFTLEQVKQLFKGELAKVIATRCVNPDNIILDNLNNQTKEERENANGTFTLNFNDLIPSVDKETNRPLTIQEQSDLMNKLIDGLEEKNKKTREEMEERTRVIKETNKLNERGMEHLENFELKKAGVCFEESIALGDPTDVSYDYIVKIYRIGELYDEEIRICDKAIENLWEERHKKYEDRKEDIYNRQNKIGKFYSDASLFDFILREEKHNLKGFLGSTYYKFEEAIKEREYIREFKKEYLKNNPTDFLLMGTKVYGGSWVYLTIAPDKEKEMFTLAGHGKYLEDIGEYKEAISFYEKASEIEKGVHSYLDEPRVNKRIEICNNKIKREQIKDLEAKAKELEKIEPAQAIELYNELNILNPNLKKYNKRIEILKKKL